MKWTEIVGQEKAKSRFDFHYDAAKAGEALPSFMLCAPRGFGKTVIAEAWGLRIRELTGDVKRIRTINAAAVKNLKQFWHSIVMPVINDRDVTLFIDEASELPDDVTMALLSMINPTATNRNKFTYDEHTIDIDLKRQSFMFATTEPHKVFHALMDRCQRVDLEEYSYGDLKTIIQRNAKGIIFAPNVLDLIAPTLRGNARQATKRAHEVKTYLAPHKKTKFTMEDWEKLSRRLDILPLGVNRIELQVLRVLEQRKDCSLTRVAATLGLSPASVQRDYELYLQRQQLMEITTTGRNLTSQGFEYLKQIKAKYDQKTTNK